MHYLLLIGAIIWFAFLVPLKVTIATGLCLLLVTSVVRYSTYAISGVGVSFGAAVKALGTSVFFLFIAGFTLLSFLAGSGIHTISGLSAIAVFGGFLSAYILGFKLSLGISFVSSLVVAFMATVVSTGAFVFVRHAF